MGRMSPLLALAALLALAGCGVRQLAVVAPRSLPALPAPAPVAALAARNPAIESLTANPSNRLQPGQVAALQVGASDPAQGVLQASWSATGGLLSANVGQAVSWTAPAAPGVYTVSVTVTNGRGGVATGALNLSVGARPAGEGTTP
jgi:hypothetical protein